ncbi:hypothetical protein SAMN04488581_0399 [Mycolicibacterium neoaurum]|uniref:hypothetical protein n=1 Tax=Mycolicibacterium neoaurum TaxID=1795 RepID=UPI000890238A|nr:hypothetical protein [Mycolicibacterium neoaurum]SDC25800.1 hypothetical protein SAMN04488581_0399 [Mycolicibacterium neoaurum]
MTELGDVFEDYLRSLSDDEWDALVSRVRTDEGQNGGSGRREAQRRQERRSGAR